MIKKGLDSSVLSSNYMKLKSAIPRNKNIKQNCSFLLWINPKLLPNRILLTVTTLCHIMNVNFSTHFCTQKIHTILALFTNIYTIYEVPPRWRRSSLFLLHKIISTECSSKKGSKRLWNIYLNNGYNLMIPTTVLLMTTWICSVPYSAIFSHSLSSDQRLNPWR